MMTSRRASTSHSRPRPGQLQTRLGPLSRARGPDRRVLRTRRTLREALISLLLERGWEATSVQDICQRADVGRSTFYLHFADKEELLVGGFEDLKALLRASPGGPAPLGFARGLLEHASENRRLFQALVGKRSGQVVVRRFRELVVALVTEGLQAAPGRAGAPTEARVQFIAGGLLGLLTWWLESGARASPEELERWLLALAPV